MRSAVGLLTVVGGAAPPTPRALPWFAVVGAGLGGLLGALWWGAGEVWPGGLAAALVVGADLALTGMLHLDGLADSADGLLPHLSRARRLEVMAGPDVGAFAIGTVAAVLLVRWAALGAAPVGVDGVALLAALWCTARTAMAVGAAALPPARPGGLAASFSGGPVAASGAVGLLLVAAAAAVGDPARTAVAAAVAAIVAVAVLWFARRRLGGVTGDVLGAVGILAETAGLVAAAVRW